MHGTSLCLVTSLSLQIKYRTLTPAIMLFKGANTIDWGGLMAGSVIAVIPVTIIFLFLQKYFLAA